MLRESKLSKFQGKIRDTEEICGSQSCQDFKPISDPFGKVLRESKLSSFKQIKKTWCLFFSLDFRGLPSSGYGGATQFGHAKPFEDYQDYQGLMYRAIVGSDFSK